MRQEDRRECIAIDAAPELRGVVVDDTIFHNRTCIFFRRNTSTFDGLVARKNAIADRRRRPIGTENSPSEIGSRRAGQGESLQHRSGCLVVFKNHAPPGSAGMEDAEGGTELGTDRDRLALEIQVAVILPIGHEDRIAADGRGLRAGHVARIFPSERTGVSATMDRQRAGCRGYRPGCEELMG